MTAAIMATERIICAFMSDLGIVLPLAAKNYLSAFFGSTVLLEVNLQDLGGTDGA